ncbi:MAG: 3-phosphoshikimate 1-carboxyvinyltransferase [Endozoicomonadaceae bacterium]|nr:3-phosphoshikimate 1-carboxyvinyltransferase [Endozoicomonadaceae bacterium]
MIPGDKSISHRAVILSSVANGISHINGFLEGHDALATVKAFEEMGVSIARPDSEQLIIKGVGLYGLKAAKEPMNLNNSGTAMRLIAGLLVGQRFDAALIGDDSLSKRPMARIIEPLRQMNAKISAHEDDCPPLYITGNQSLKGIKYALPVDSAQVKSCLLLAGLYAKGMTTVIEKSVTRDHTERMLTTFGYPIAVSGSTKTIQSGLSLQSAHVDIPKDISSAAFLIVAALITPQSHIILPSVGVNPTRAGIITILKKMGAKIRLLHERMMGAEPVADIEVSYSVLIGVDIPHELVSIAIDEFPILFIAAACATGMTRLTNAQELRVKESDRLTAMSAGLTTLGIHHITHSDGIEIEGGCFQGGMIDSYGDHRIAMAFAVAGLRAASSITVLNCEAVATSFPNFMILMRTAGMHIQADIA